MFGRHGADFCVSISDYGFGLLLFNKCVRRGKNTCPMREDIEFIGILSDFGEREFKLKRAHVGKKV